MASARWRISLAAVVTLAAAATAQARVQDYQVVRLISYHTSCDLDHLENVSPATGPLRYRATCGNLTSYPDGLEVVCDDRADERSCKVVTSERDFRNLELLKPQR